MKFFRFGALCVLSVLAGSAAAQERTAGSTLETQMTWSALANQIQALNTRVTAVDSRVDQAVACGKLGLVYGPSSPNANAQGCVEATDKTGGTDMTDIVNTLTTLSANYTTINTKLTNVLNCGGNGALSTADGKSCKSIDSSGGLRWRVTNTVSQCNNRQPSGTRCSGGAAPGASCTTKGQSCFASSMPGVYVPSSGSCASSSNGPYNYVMMECN